MRPIPSYPGYSITEDGKCFTHRKRFGKGVGKGGGVRIDNDFIRELAAYPGHGGYLYFAISTERGQRSIPVHVLLADAFLGPTPAGQEVRHFDGNHRNNDLTNLRYGTPKQNAEDRIRCGKAMRGQSHPRAKLTTDQVQEIRLLRMENRATPNQLAARFGVDHSTIRHIASGRSWKHVTFKRIERGQA